MFNQIRKRLANALYSAVNSMNLPNEFLRLGNRKVMHADWSEVMMNDRDHYTGYGYAAITKRARAVARLAAEHIRTEKAGDPEVEVTDIHPYLPLIQDSRTFSENQFWQMISIFLDLEGWFPLMVLRNTDTAKNPQGTGDMGSALKFELLNPYEVTRIINQETMEVGGYREIRNGMQRDIPAGMIIDIREINPFNRNTPYAMTDAARESSYTLKSSGDYTRHVLRNNVDAPGIISTDVILPAEQFKNFVARMKEHVKGDPIFGNGAGAVKWTPMTNDLSKSALKDITEVHRDVLFAVSGVSKTKMGIEQSGTTRETSNVQKDQFIEDEIVPRINTVLDALNLDYKNRYGADYKKNNLVLGIYNPIESDQDVEGKKVDNKQKSFNLYQSIIDAGYEENLAARFAEGEISLDDLGKPTRPPKQDPAITPTPETKGRKKQFLQLNELSRSVIQDQESMLQNAIVNVDGQLAVAAINRVPKHIKNGVFQNQIESEEDLITRSDKKDAMNELILVLTAFYGVITTIQGKETIKDRIEKYGGEAKYLIDKIAKEGIRRTAEKVAKSHVDSVSESLYKIAREAAMQGKSQLEVIGELKSHYSYNVTEHRARTIARTETNRAFTMAQYDADRQFIEQNDLEERAYKRYHTRSDNPCAFCKELERQGLIPFHEPFVKKGSQVTAKVDGQDVSFDVNFESVYAGNLHPNCSCDYELVITKEKKKK